MEVSGQLYAPADLPTGKNFSASSGQDTLFHIILGYFITA
jgi:hypothetical protein